MRPFFVVTPKDLDTLISIHRLYLKGNALYGTVAGIPPEFRSDSRAQLLQAVVFYNNELLKGGSAENWVEAFRLFRLVEPMKGNSEFSFHAAHYCFLAAKHVDTKSDALQFYFSQAIAAASKAEEPLHNHLMGLMQHTWSKHRLDLNNIETALKFWQLAAQNRTIWYRHCAESKGDHGVLCAAATDIWHMFAQFAIYFPDIEVKECGIHRTLFDEVGPLADKTVFVKKP